MSSDFYWKKWLQVLARLERTVNIDTEFQTSKAHDQKRCHAAQRLSGVLGAYSTIYNDAMECLHQNLQVQKTLYIAAVIKTVVARVLELKQELQKLESRNFQFLGHGLVTHNITTYDTELTEMPSKSERTEAVEAGIEEAFRKVKDKKEMLERLAEAEKQKALEEIETVKVPNFWDEDKDVVLSKDAYQFGEIKDEDVDEETLERRRLLKVIQAHERTRQVTKNINLSKLKRETWERELTGTLNPQATNDVKERSAKIIQQVCRAYFEIKREKIKECKRDELLGLLLCKPHKVHIENENIQAKQKRNMLANKYDSEWITFCEDLKQKYLKKRGADIAEDVRDEIRNWFLKWFDEVKFINDIPSESKGGSALVVKEEVPTPSEWLDEYQIYLEKKRTNKGKTASELKYEKQRNKKEASANKREERMKQALQDKLMKKMMKNPKMHPGYLYPKSKMTEEILKAIEDYHAVWDKLDLTGSKEVKEGSVRNIDVDRICMDVKLEVRSVIDEEMRNELKVLKKALKKDYKRNEEPMPESMTKPSRKKKHKKKSIPSISEKVSEKMQDLIFQGVLKEYPRRTFTDFLGDHNFAGDDYRCLYTSEPAYGGEIRNIWWERARESLIGFRRILLVGPRESGKTILVHALASANDAVLYELDPSKVGDEEALSTHLKELVKTVTSCAKATQPAVIYIRHVQKLFYIKTPPEEANANLELKSRYFIKRLFKRINKKDKVTIIGSCVEPWLAKGQILKRFPEVVLVPTTNYTVVVKLLNDWVLRNHTVPRDLNVQSLAHVLQGYPYGFLSTALDNFLTAERIIKIAAYGLFPQDIYDYILQDETTTKTEYEKYQEWYYKKTPWGKKEMQHIEEELEFKAVTEKWEEKAQKRKKKVKIPATILEDVLEE